MSAGSIVDINEDKSTPSSMYKQITAEIGNARRVSDTMEGLLATAIIELKAVALDYNPNIQNVDFILTPLEKPVFPSAPSLVNFTSDIWLSIFNKVKGDIDDGGTGLSEVTYNAIIARELAARQSAQDKAYRLGLDSVGARGFNLLSGHIAMFQRDVIREMLERDQDSINNLLIKDFDLATENTRFAITTGVELEKILRATWDSAENRKVDIYTANVKGISDQYSALVEWGKMEIENNRLETEIAIKNEELRLDAYKSMTALTERISEAIANVTAQSLASALGAINTSMSHGYSGSESKSENWGHSESLTESHNFSDE